MVWPSLFLLNTFVAPLSLMVPHTSPLSSACRKIWSYDVSWMGRIHKFFFPEVVLEQAAYLGPFAVEFVQWTGAEVGPKTGTVTRV